MTKSFAESKHHAYVEAFGKSGIYGVGYEYGLASRFRLGTVGSYDGSDGEVLASGSFYLGFTLRQRGRHRFFTHVGPTLVYRKIASPVQEWDGAKETKLAGHVSAGYEFHWGRIFVRGYGMLSVGEGGVAPWLGLSLGASF